MARTKPVDVYRIDSHEKTLAETVSELSERVDRLELANRGDVDGEWGEPDDVDLYGDMWDSANVLVEPKRPPGNPSPLSKEQFARRRDDTIGFFENFWPEIEEVIPKGEPSPEVLHNALKRRFPGRDEEHTFKRLLTNINLVHEAIYGNVEWSRTPRQLGYALAGVPEVTLRTSWDRGRSKREKSLRPIQFRAMREHIEREHEKWYKRILERGVADKITMKYLPENCPNCIRFLKRPERLMPAIQVQPFPLPPSLSG